MNPEQRDAVLAHWIPTERGEHYGAHWEGGLAGNQYALIPTKRPSPGWTWEGEGVALVSVNLWTHTSEGVWMDAPTLMDVRWDVEPPTVHRTPGVCDAAAIAHFTAWGLVNVANARVEKRLAASMKGGRSRKGAMELVSSFLRSEAGFEEGEAEGYWNALEAVVRLVEGMDYLEEEGQRSPTRRGVAVRVREGLAPALAALRQTWKDTRRDAGELERIRHEQAYPSRTGEGGAA